MSQQDVLPSGLGTTSLMPRRANLGGLRPRGAGKAVRAFVTDGRGRDIKSLVALASHLGVDLPALFGPAPKRDRTPGRPRRPAAE